MIDFRTPCSLIMLSIYGWAKLSTNYFFFIANFWEPIYNYPNRIITSERSGQIVTKSMVICSHFHWGISILYINPDGLLFSAFTYWQIRHLVTNSATSFFMPCHQFFFQILIHLVTIWMYEKLQLMSFVQYFFSHFSHIWDTDSVLKPDNTLLTKSNICLTY